MAEIYQIPENSGTPQFTVPIGGFGGNGGFGFGNGMNGIVDLFGLAIIASIFGWGNGGFGGGFGGGNGQAAFLSNQLANDSGRELIMQAINNNGEASRSAIQNLATMLGQDFNLVNTGVQNVQNALQTLALQQAVSVPQIINSIQSGDASIISAFQKCCCENQLAMCQQTNTLMQGLNANAFAAQQGFSSVNQSLAAKAAADQLATCQQTYALTDTMNKNFIAIDNKLDAMESGRKDREITALTAKVAQLESQNFTTSVVQQAVSPILGSLNGIRAEVDAIKRSQPATITLPNNSMTAVPTIWANAVADNIVDRIATALTPTTTTTTGGAGA